MSLYKRGDVWWYDFTVNGERYRGSTGFRYKEDARKVEDRERRRAALGEVHRPVATLEQATRLWFVARAEGRKSVATTAQRVKIMLRHLGPATPVSQIGPREITEALDRRRLEITRQRRVPTNGTINRDMIDTTLRPILAYAKENLEEPVRDIKWGNLRLPEPKERIRSFSPDELARWRAALPIWHQPLFDFLARYGLRLREAFFPLDAINLEAAEIFVGERKNGAYTVALLEEDIPGLKARMGRARAAKLDTVWFREMKSGKLTAIHWRGFQSASKKALEAAGIDDARPAHDLRHHAATELLRATGNMRLVQALLGHQVLASSARYAHTSKADLRAGLRHAYGTKSPGDETEISEDKSLAEGRSGT